MSHVNQDSLLFDERCPPKLRMSDFIPIMGYRHYEARTKWPIMTWNSSLDEYIASKTATNATILMVYNLTLGSVVVTASIPAIGLLLEKLVK